MASDNGKPPVAARLLTAGAKRADRVARATGVDRALDEAVEEAIVRALRSPAIARAVERAMADHGVEVELDPDELAGLVKRVLDSEAADQVWAEVLASDQAQMLVERIARAPEVRAALASQSAGLITDIGIRLTKITEALDDAMERVVRRRDPDSETIQAGLATRLVAAGVDLGLLAIAWSLASGVLASVIQFTFGSQLTLASAIVIGVIEFLVGGAIFVTFWGLAGQTPGMRFLAIRITKDGAHHLSFRTAFRRMLGLIVSLAPFGLGYFSILRDPHRRAWHDRMTGTEVVYDIARRTAPHASFSPRAALPGQTEAEVAKETAGTGR